MRSSRVCIGLSLACAAVAFEASALAVPIYGGPTYNPATRSGYQHVGESYRSEPMATAGNGVAVGTPFKFVAGEMIDTRPFRWDASGTVTELGILSGGESWAWAVNVTGTAAGYSRTNGDRAVRWAAASAAATELGNLGTDNSGYASDHAFAINSAGTIVGDASRHSGNTSLGSRAVRWDASGTAATELGNLGTSSSGVTESKAIAINDSGTTVGLANKYIDGNLRGNRAVRWDASGTVATELGNIGTNLVGYTQGHVYGINNAGTTIGSMWKFNGNAVLYDRAVRWEASGTAATELDSLVTPISGTEWSIAYAINDAGTAVGMSGKYNADGSVSLGSRAVRWNASGTAVTELGNLGTGSNGAGALGYTGSAALAVNSAGVAVGFARSYSTGPTSDGYRAVGWGADSAAAVDLNTLLSPDDAAHWLLTGAGAISDTYWVTGYGTFDPDGSSGSLLPYQRDYLLDVISFFGIKGDANRDGHVNFPDILLLAQHYGQTSGAVWDDGDFTADGRVNFDDLLTLAKRYEPTGSAVTASLDPAFAADWATALSLAPEPTSAVLLVGMSLLSRKRR